MISKLAEKLRDPEHRKAFVASQINIGIPFQIRALLKARRKTQEWLANKTGMLQPRISGLMTPGKTRPNIETLRRLAEAFDCGLAVRFVPFSELGRWSESFDPESFYVPPFDEDAGFIEKQPAQSEQTQKIAATAAANRGVVAEEEMKAFAAGASLAGRTGWTPIELAGTNLVRIDAHGR